MTHIVTVPVAPLAGVQSVAVIRQPVPLMRTRATQPCTTRADNMTDVTSVACMNQCRRSNAQAGTSTALAYRWLLALCSAVGRHDSCRGGRAAAIATPLSAPHPGMASSAEIKKSNRAACSSAAVIDSFCTRALWDKQGYRAPRPGGPVQHS